MSGKATAANEPEAYLPSGIGLDFEAVHHEILSQTGRYITKDDSIMVMVPVMNAFLGQEDRLLQRHVKTLGLSKELYEAMPDRISQAAKAALGDVQTTAKYITQASIQQGAAKMAEAGAKEMAKAAREVTSKAIGRSYWEWAAACFVVAVALLALAAQLGRLDGFKTGRAERVDEVRQEEYKAGYGKGIGEGYEKAKDEKAAANWANTKEGKALIAWYKTAEGGKMAKWAMSEPGKQAYKLSQATNLDVFSKCTGEGWFARKDPENGATYCVPSRTRKGVTTTWRMP